MTAYAWSKFYWQDWLGDPELRCCRPATRGLWIDMLCAMAKSTRPGYLLLSGKAPTFEEMASMFRCTPEEASDAVAELLKFGVCSQTRLGVLVSRRLVRDFAAREKGAKAAAHPKQTSSDETSAKPDRNAVDEDWSKSLDALEKTTDPQGSPQAPPKAPPQAPPGVEAEAEGDKSALPTNIQPSLTFGQSPILTADTPPKKPPEKPGLKPTEVEAAFAEWWQAYPRKKNRCDALAAYRIAVRKLPPKQLLAALRAYRFSTEPQFIKHPNRWLKGECWLDVPEEPAPVRGTPTLRLAGGTHAPPSDPSDLWGIEAWVRTLPDAPPDKTGKPCLNGWYPAIIAEECARAAGLDTGWRGRLDVVADWLRADIVYVDVILPIIRSIAGRPGYKPPASMAFFDAKVREVHALNERRMANLLRIG